MCAQAAEGIEKLLVADGLTDVAVRQERPVVGWEAVRQVVAVAQRGGDVDGLGRGGEVPPALVCHDHHSVMHILELGLRGTNWGGGEAKS